jgi:hypothetical protein
MRIQYQEENDNGVSLSYFTAFAIPFRPGPFNAQ